jgi:uncharacterized membrane protein
VLAIGLLVDDAIVVVENVERLMAENPGMSPRDATIASMKEISVALVAIALVLSAVFLPMAFFGGSTGVIYRQFSLTIVAAMALSVMVALILSPALTTTLLKRPEDEDETSLVGRASHWMRVKFDKYFGKLLAGTTPRRTCGYPQAPSGDRLCGDAGAAGLPVHAPAHRLPAQRGSGLWPAQLPAARRCHHRAHAAGPVGHREILLNRSPRTSTRC